MNKAPQKAWMWIRENRTLPERDLKKSRNMNPRKPRKYQGLQVSNPYRLWIRKYHYHSIFMLVIESHGTSRIEKRLKHVDPRWKSSNLQRSHHPLWLFSVEGKSEELACLFVDSMMNWKQSLTSGLKVLSQNVQGLTTEKEDLLLELMDQLHLDLLFIQENFPQLYQGSGTQFVQFLSRAG